MYPLSAQYQQPKLLPTPRRTIKADVVALDQPYMWNRLGASQPNAMIYALARDVVPTDYDPEHPVPLDFAKFEPGKVRLREDKRPRPLVLRVNEGDELVVTFTNLLNPSAPVSTASLTRYAGFHAMGLELLKEGGINNDSSWVGTNPPVKPNETQKKGSTDPSKEPGREPGSVCAPGATKVYRYYAKAEGTYLVHSFSADSPLANQTSQLQSGLFGVVNVQPEGAEYYRSQVTREDLEQATYYVEDSQERELQQKRRTVAALSLAERIKQSHEYFIYLPVQSGVYRLDPPPSKRTNMQLQVKLDMKADPLTVDIHGVDYEVYTLTTVVPAPVTQVQNRTFKTTSVVLIHRPGDPPTWRRLHLVNLESTPYRLQHLVNYLALYPPGAKYPSGQAIPDGTPVLSMLNPPPDPDHAPKERDFKVVDGDLTAIITGPNHDRWPYSITGPLFRENPSSPDRRQPYREFTIVYHYNFSTVQAFPQLNTYATTGGDYFGINYGCAGIGAEILSNRLGVGPMGRKDAVDLKFEEFFLSSWSCGDPAMVVDVPANANNQALTNTDGLPAAPPVLPGVAVIPSPGALVAPKKPGDGATKAYYPDDPSNVYHSYMRDHVKFRVLNASEGVTHVHHQHAHQWLHTPNSDNGQYLDSQTVVAGSGYTMEITYGGSGNRNYPVGDAIFHCHFYPHFAEGMWSLWRVHDTFEAGTRLDKDGRPVTQVTEQGGKEYVVYREEKNGVTQFYYVDSQGHRQSVMEKEVKPAWNRAQPDGEIMTGTPIPAIVPMPSLAMAPTPARLHLIDDGRRVEVEKRGPEYENPGYPFFIPAVAGHRPPHPPLDYAWKEDAYGNPVYDPATGQKVYLDGGLPRHQVLDGDLVRNLFTPWDFSKDFVVVGPPPNYEATAGGLVAFELPQEGTAIEKAAMKTHSTRSRKSYLPDGNPGNFILNGLPAVPGAPYAPPGVRGEGESNVNVRRYKAAVLQLDVVLNKKGWHFPQQRLLTLWDDVAPTVTGVRAPQPFFFRSNTDDTIEYWHTNLVPSYYEMDDFQVRTPTDVLGQHIHLVKFDVTSSDGAGNGYNYEDGTFSPQEVRERIAAVNAKGGIYEFDENAQYKGKAQRTLKVVAVNEAYPLDPKVPSKGSLFGQPPPFQNWDGAQTTVQRFDTDPTLNGDGLDRTVRSVFTHDHFSPSTHQQAGYYAALLVEPDNSTWEIPVITPNALNQPTVVYEQGGQRHDGGPTSWQANIITADPAQSYREFAIEFQDMQLAYLAASTSVLRTPSQLRSTAAGSFTLSAPAQAELKTHKPGDKIPAVAGDPSRADFQKKGIKLSSDAVLTNPPTGIGFQINDPGGAPSVVAYSIDPLFRVSTIVTAGPLFTLNPAAKNEINNILKPGDAIPKSPTDPVRSQLLSFGIDLSENGATLATGTSPFLFQINDVRATDAAGKPIIIERYPLDNQFGLYTPDMAPGWSDPANTVNAPGANPTTPKPQLISFGTIGTYSVGYRNEPLPLRVAIPVPGKPESTDLAYSYASIERGDSDLNIQPAFFAMDRALKKFLVPPGGNVPPEIIKAFGDAGVTLPNSARLIFNSSSHEWNIEVPGKFLTTYAIKEFAAPIADNLYVFTSLIGSLRSFSAPLVPLSANPNDGGVSGLDPYTPMLRAYANDRVQVRALAGAHMDEHSFTIHGVKYYFEPSYTNSGFQNTQAISLSEHFEMEFTVPGRTATQENPFADFLYAPSGNAQGQTSGAWGVLRAYDGEAYNLGNPYGPKKGPSDPLSPTYLKSLPNNERGKAPQTLNFAKMFAAAPADQKQEYTVVASTVAQVLPTASLYYNSRGQASHNYPFQAALSATGETAKLENRYALIYVNGDDLGADGKLRSDMHVEPLILRANAGDWIKINLVNQFNPGDQTFNLANPPNNQGAFPTGNPFIRLASSSRPQN